ncbi:uncharacterized protein LOC108632044 [Ceratina calcarata]|uniref:Uncharacterized protein LOC108632044 n=1 Tax=Ceratina calcarata TaxID=156304 RepID=A0AAJ7NEW9_9HYME|nr:uncharacterized protein LOC108632044 [Ceratina calcarata]
MNPQVMLASVLAVVFIGFVAYRMKVRSLDNDLSTMPPLVDNSSLEEDLKDILAFVPMHEAKRIIEDYMKYDAQIGDTVTFIDDQKRFIAKEFEKMKEFEKLVRFLRENGLDVDGWQEKIRLFWKTSPRYKRFDPNIANGGLTVMINKILETVPMDELHELLRQKVKYSGSFRRFIHLLRSRDFRDFCDAVEENDVLHHHYFWAKEAGLEITFAIELFNELYTHLTESLTSVHPSRL